jgi:sirohydrochlorin ferrochelatase
LTRIPSAAGRHHGGTAGRARRAALLVIGHGSRVAAANRLLRDVARRLRGRFPGRIVEACYLEAARPDIASAIATCAGRGAARILLIPYFLYLGGHVKHDLPRLAARAQVRHPGVRIRIAPHLGADPRLVSVVADRARRGLRTSRWR